MHFSLHLLHNLSPICTKSYPSTLGDWLRKFLSLGTDMYVTIMPQIERVEQIEHFLARLRSCVFAFLVIE